MTTETKDSENAVIVQDPCGKNIEITLKDEERTRTSVWSRVMGYHRPTSYYNIGKKQEFADRKYFKQPKED